MKAANLVCAMNCFAAALLLNNGWLALIGFGNLFAFGLMFGVEVYETLTREVE